MSSGIDSAPAPAPAEQSARHVGFGDRLHRRVTERRSQLVLGLDPDPMRLWPRAIELVGGTGATSDPPADRAARAVAAHCALAIEAVAEHCVAVKLQLACFERLGAPGWAAAFAVARTARDHGLIVIADAKRGDVDVTAKAYAQTFLGATPTPFGTVSGLRADALTVNPLLGVDSLEPFIDMARPAGAGVFVLVRTSNPGAADVEARALADGGDVSEGLAAIVGQLGASGVGANGLADIGAVVGATAPERLAQLRELMPHTVFLLPGVGAQGGRVEDLAPAFAPGPAGGLVSASRGIITAHELGGGEAAAAAKAEARRLQERAWTLAS